MISGDDTDLGTAVRCATSTSWDHAIPDGAGPFCPLCDADMPDLKRHVAYAGGYHGRHRVVQWLWQVVEEMEREQAVKEREEELAAERAERDARRIAAFRGES